MKSLHALLMDAMARLTFAFGAFFSQDSLIIVWNNFSILQSTIQFHKADAVVSQAAGVVQDVSAG